MCRMTIVRTTLNNIRTSFYQCAMTDSTEETDERRFASGASTEQPPVEGPASFGNFFFDLIDESTLFGLSSFDTLSATNFMSTHRHSTFRHSDNRYAPTNFTQNFLPKNKGRCLKAKNIKTKHLLN